MPGPGCQLFPLADWIVNSCYAGTSSLRHAERGDEDSLRATWLPACKTKAAPGIQITKTSGHMNVAHFQNVTEGSRASKPLP